MTKPTTQLAVRRNTAVTSAKTLEQPATSFIRDDVAEGSYLFGFDPGIPANEPLVYACEQQATHEASQHLTEPFRLWCWAVKKVAVKDANSGDTIPAVRLVLIDPDGETLAFVSMGAVLSLDMLRQLKGDGPYDPPIPVYVREIKTRQGWRLYKFVPESALRERDRKK